MSKQQTSKKQKQQQKLSHEEFVGRAIKSLRKGDYKGIHSVYSGFNVAFKEYFKGEDPVDATNALAKDGRLVVKLVRGGAYLILPEDVDTQRETRAKSNKALKTMGLE